MNELDAIGTMTTGALLAGTIEAERLAGADGHTHEQHCLNCRTALVGDYCHACGQHGHAHRTLHAFFHDLLHGVFHVEGRTWRTLPLLAWKPGELTRRYVEGERAKFVSPMALFLFTVFLLFAVLGNLMSATNLNQLSVGNGMDQSIANDRGAVATLQRERATAVTAGRPTAKIDASIKEHEDDARLLEAMRSKGFVKGGASQFSSGLPSWLADPLKRAADNPDFTIYKLKSSAYKWSWALIPLSVPFLWLLFPFSRRFRMYDHTVFVTYSLSFVSLLVVVVAQLSKVGIAAAPLALFLVPPLHMYRQLKGAYGLSRGGAGMRASVLAIFSVV